jgi:hypothetical protein
LVRRLSRSKVAHSSVSFPIDLLAGRNVLNSAACARCAWDEILKTALRSTLLFAFVEDLLEPGRSATTDHP